MAYVKKIHLHLRLLAAIIPVLFIYCFFLIPKLLQTESSLTPLKFTAKNYDGNKNTVVLNGSFNRDISEHERIWIYAENAMIEFQIKNTRIRFNELGKSPAIFRSPGSGWYSFSSPGIRNDDPVEITIRSYYSESERAVKSLLHRLYTGDGAGFLQLMLNQIDFFSIVLVCAFIAGIIFMVEGVIYVALGMTVEGQRIVLFGFYCFSGGIWCIPDMLYPYITMIISSGWVAAILDMSGLLLFPIALALMMRYYIRGIKNRQVMNGIILCEIFVAGVCILFQLMGKADLMEQQLIIGSIALILIGIAMVCVIRELYCYRDGYLLYLFLTVLPVFISEALDGINIIWPFMPRRVLMQHSFGLSILLLIFQFASYANTELAKAETIHKMQIELTDSRISIMLSQIQPHFLYNSLQGIKLLCDTNPSRASEALEHFAYYLRGNLDSLANTRLVPFEKELVHIRDYLYLEKMRFSKKLNIKWELDYEDFLLPPLTAQPLIENAIRHGINKKKGGGTLTIKSKQSLYGVTITIHDDGVGFDPQEMKGDGKSHVGIENTKNRLKLLCGGTLLIDSIKGEGTTAKIFIPKRSQKNENYISG